MKKLTTILLGTTLITGLLFAHDETNNMQNMHHEMNQKSSTQQHMMDDRNNTHMGDHMHNGKMSNHGNPNGITDEHLQEMIKMHKYIHQKIEEESQGHMMKRKNN